MRNLCFNCPYNKGLELGNGCGNDTCIQENMLFEKDEEPVEIEKLNQQNLKLIKENQKLKQRLAEKDQDKISFAIKQLEKVKDWCKEYRTIDEFGVFTINVDDVLNTEDNLLNFIDNQIKQLEEK